MAGWRTGTAAGAAGDCKPLRTPFCPADPAWEYYTCGRHHCTWRPPTSHVRRDMAAAPHSPCRDAQSRACVRGAAGRRPALRLQVWTPPGMLAAARTPFPDACCPVRAGVPGMPPRGRRRGQAGMRGRPSRSMTCPTRAGSGRNCRGHEKSGGHVPPRGSPIPKTGAKDAGRPAHTLTVH